MQENSPEEYRSPENGGATSLRVLAYNHALGWDMRELRGNLGAHIPYYLGYLGTLRSKCSIEPTMEMVREHQPDVVAIAEVLGETQRYALWEALQKEAYSSCHVGQGEPLGGKEHLEILLATKNESIALPAPIRFEGGGSGIVAAHLPDQACDLVFCHIEGQSFLKRFLGPLKRFLRERKKHHQRFLFGGDLNVTTTMLPRFLRGMKRYSPDRPTCTTTRFLRPFFQQCIDHILGHGFRHKESRLLSGYSDHSAILTEIVPVKKWSPTA